MDEMEKHGIRVDIDDREMTLSRRIKDAEVMWVPYIVIIGRKEMEDGVLSVRFRDGEVKRMNRSEIIELITKELKGYPKEPLYSNKFLSKRATFA